MTNTTAGADAEVSGDSGAGSVVPVRERDNGNGGGRAVSGDALGRLKHQTHVASALIDSVKSLIGDDAQLRLSTVEGETQLFEAIDGAVARVLDLEKLIEGLDNLIDAMTARKKRFETQHENIKTAIGAAMEAAGVRKLELPTLTLSVGRVPPKAQIIDESVIPSAYWKEQEPKLDKKAVLNALKQGHIVNGALLDNGSETVRMRMR